MNEALKRKPRETTAPWKSANAIDLDMFFGAAKSRRDSSEVVDARAMTSTSPERVLRRVVDELQVGILRAEVRGPSRPGHGGARGEQRAQEQHRGATAEARADPCKQRAKAVSSILWRGWFREV